MAQKRRREPIDHSTPRTYIPNQDKPAVNLAHISPSFGTR